MIAQKNQDYSHKMDRKALLQQCTGYIQSLKGQLIKDCNNQKKFSVGDFYLKTICASFIKKKMFYTRFINISPLLTILIVYCLSKIILFTLYCSFSYFLCVQEDIHMWVLK